MPERSAWHPTRPVNRSCPQYRACVGLANGDSRQLNPYVKHWAYTMIEGIRDGEVIHFLGLYEHSGI